MRERTLYHRYNVVITATIVSGKVPEPHDFGLLINGWAIDFVDVLEEQVDIEDEGPHE